MARKSRIAGAGVAVSAALLLASCGGGGKTDRKEVEDLEDKITELEDANRLLRDQLEEAKSAASEAPTEAASLPPLPVSESPTYPDYSPVETRPREPRHEDAFTDDDKANAIARAAADAAQDAKDAAGPD